MKSRLVALEHQGHEVHQVQTAVAELVKKDQEIATLREENARIKMMEQTVAKQLKELVHENERFKYDQRVLELNNNRSAANSPCSNCYTLLRMAKLYEC